MHSAELGGGNTPGANVECLIYSISEGLDWPYELAASFDPGRRLSQVAAMT